jgi:DNA-binding NtrC family response regulator
MPILGNHNGCTHSLRPDTRCLVVESNFIIFMDLEHIVHSLGVTRVDHVKNVAEALNMIDETMYGFVILDCDPPTENFGTLGDELISQGVPVAVIATHSDAQQLHPELRGFPIIVKPFLTSTVEIVIRKFLHSV